MFLWFVDVGGSMKAIETRSPHKYSLVPVGRGYWHQAVELGGCSSGRASQSDDKGLFCWTGMPGYWGLHGVGERGQVAARWPNSRWMSYGKMSLVRMQLAWCDPQHPMLTAGRVFIPGGRADKGWLKESWLTQHVHTRQREPLVSY